MPIDENQCPLCGGNNACGAHSDAPCWCCATAIPPGLLGLIPAEKQMKACVCQTCVTKFQQEQQTQA